jgi:hypothetical protein
MLEKIDEEVSVVLVYSARHRRVVPYTISWRNTDYRVGKIGYHHCVNNGQTLHHIFELVNQEQSIWFRLNLDTSNLHWRLEAIHDGNPN